MSHPPTLQQLDPFETFEARKESRKSLLGFSLVYLTGYFTDPPALFHPELIHALESEHVPRGTIQDRFLQGGDDVACVRDRVELRVRRIGCCQRVGVNVRGVQDANEWTRSGARSCGAGSPSAALTQLSNQMTALGTVIGNDLFPLLDMIAKDMEPIIADVSAWADARRRRIREFAYTRHHR
jgi:hypothetical protein